MRVNFYLLAIGLLISVAISNVLAEHRTSADLTDEELGEIRMQFDQIMELGNMTCENYDQKCPNNTSKRGSKRGYFCKQFSKAYICEKNHTLENVRKAVAVLEQENPAFVDSWIKSKTTDEVIGS